MRKYAKIPSGPYGRVIMHSEDDGVFLFLIRGDADRGSEGCDWFPSVAEAEQWEVEELGVHPGDWVRIDDPLPGCLQDVIAPVRVVGRKPGNPESGVCEKLENGKWVPFDPPAD